MAAVVMGLRLTAGTRSLRAAFRTVPCGGTGGSSLPVGGPMTFFRSKMVVAVVAPEGVGPAKEALSFLPKDAPADFLIANDLDTFLSSPKLQDVEGMLWIPPGDPAVMSALWPHLPQIKWVHSFFAGVDGLDGFVKRTLLSSAVPMSNGRGAFSDSLAEYVMAAALHFNKQIPRCQQNRAGRRWDKFVMDTVAGKTMGFVGFGHIGQVTARMAKAGFGMKVLALRRNPGKADNSDLADATYGPDEKLELFRNSDFVVSVLPGTADTVDYIGQEEFAAMKPTAVFISIGRGVVVDEAALDQALGSGAIAGAALDVFKREPLPEDHPLWRHENLLLTAHNADYTPDYFELGWKVWRANLECVQQGKPVATPVDTQLGY